MAISDGSTTVMKVTKLLLLLAAVAVITTVSGVSGKKAAAAVDAVEVKSVSSPAECPRRVASGDFVRFHYNGTLKGGKAFDSSYEKGSTYNMFVGKKLMVAGMDQGLLGMCVNELRTIRVPAALGYGKEGLGDSIPANAELFFSVLLVDVWNPEDKVAVHTYSLPEPCERKVQSTDYVRYHYNGTLLDGTPFDSSYTRKSTYNTYVGMGWLIAGMDQGLLGMCVNERRFVTIPPQLGYGESGYDPVIPAQASLVFDVLLLDLHNPNDRVDIKTYLVPENCTRKTKSSDYVRYHYNGTLLDGTPFDSSHSRNRTYNTYLGLGNIIAGMEEGLLDMCVNERRIVTIPPHLGYGEGGTGSIPGSAVLVFDINLIDFHNPKDEVQTDSYFQPEECFRKSRKGDLVQVHYNGTYMDGSPLDSSHKYGKTYDLILGSGRVVLGLDQALTGMCVGEKRMAIIPPHLGYGEQGIDGDVPGSAVLVFDLELVALQEGLPEGYLFIWDGDVPTNLFELMDSNKDGHVSLEEFTAYLKAEVAAGKGRLAPGSDPDKVIGEMFTNQDRNKDGRITAPEFKLKAEEDAENHDEL